MRFIKELLSEGSQVSATRFTHVLGLFMAFIIALIGLHSDKDLTALSVLVLSFIVPQTIAKVAQKRMEKK